MSLTLPQLVVPHFFLMKNSKQLCTGFHPYSTLGASCPGCASGAPIRPLSPPFPTCLTRVFSTLPLGLHLSLCSHSAFSRQSLPLSSPSPLSGTSTHQAPGPPLRVAQPVPAGGENSQCPRPCCPGVPCPCLEFLWGH